MKRITKEKIKEYCTINTVKKQTIITTIILVLLIVIYFSPSIRLEMSNTIEEKYLIRELWIGLSLIGVGVLIFLKSIIQYFTAESILSK